MNKRLTTDEFIKKAKKIHGEKYDYSKVNYIDSSIKVCIICPVHGEFLQLPTNHYKYGCRKCGIVKRSENRTLNEAEFLKRCKNKFGDKYDFSLTKYSKMKNKVKVICSKHGEFEQYALALYRGVGCPKCANKSITNEEFIEKARKIHGDKYDYSEVKYDKSHKNVCIICPEHGEFWQTPNNHLNGKGCPICNESHLENEVRLALCDSGIEYEQWKHFSWLGKQTLDFYIKNYNIGIECQGGQHFIDEKFMGGIETIKNRDKNKNKVCNENGLILVYYFKEKFNKYYKFNNRFFNNVNDLVNFIKYGRTRGT